ncbi:MAG: DUF3696 domain-containing protein [Magnetococcales bacterium]|nr:DUF3696 domain-containing protein [Magnetococcales bacterium]
MLRHLRIKKFKGWKDSGDIVMAPVTLFFGANSSGKSSIGQFLMMLKQTAESPDRKAVFFPGDNKSAVQLGSYQEMVFRRASDQSIEFSYTWDCPDFREITDPLTNTKYSGATLEFMANVALDKKNQQSVRVEKLEYKVINAHRDTVLSIGLNRQQDRLEYGIDVEPYRLVRKPGRVWKPGPPVRFYGFPDEVVAYHQNAEFVSDFNLYQENLFRSICYLGPLRTKASRLYSWSGIEPDSVGYAGENTISAILSANARKIGVKKPNMQRASPANPFEAVIADALKKMELIQNFKVSRLAEQRHEYEVKLQVRGADASVDLPDVGFGISQVLPVLVQCYYAPAGSIILMEQPEIHLHPRAQSALADVLIDVIQSRENGSDRNIQLIIETHSEHFLRRLQRRIAEDVIPREHVSAYFANVDGASSVLTPLEIDKYGNIINWPENFFGDEMGDITGQAKAAMERRKKERASAKSNAHE